MTHSAVDADLAMHVAVAGSLVFTDFEPRDCPGYTSDIAKQVGVSSKQTAALLRSFDILSDDHHYEVKRELLREKVIDREITPAMYRVTIRPA